MAQRGRAQEVEKQSWNIGQREQQQAQTCRFAVFLEYQLWQFPLKSVIQDFHQIVLLLVHHEILYIMAWLNMHVDNYFMNKLLSFWWCQAGTTDWRVSSSNWWILRYSELLQRKTSSEASSGSLQGIRCLLQLLLLGKISNMSPMKKKIDIEVTKLLQSW